MKKLNFLFFPVFLCNIAFADCELIASSGNFCCNTITLQIGDRACGPSSASCHMTNGTQGVVHLCGPRPSGFESEEASSILLKPIEELEKTAYVVHEGKSSPGSGFINSTHHGREVGIEKAQSLPKDDESKLNGMFHDVIKISDDVYAGTGVAKSGEKIYFGMERVDESNLKKWDEYGNLARWVVHRTLDLLSNPEDISEEIYGFSNEEGEKFIRLLQSLKKEKIKAFKEIYSGIGGFSLSRVKVINSGISIDTDGFYVVYASKRPVTGKFFANRNHDKIISLNLFNEIYDDLLMSLRTVMLDDAVHNNRGIFRNPKSFLDGGYSDIALKLHGFSSTVAKTYFGKKYMSVSPIKGMADILRKNLDRSAYYVGSKIPNEFQSSFEDLSTGEWKFLIQIDALTQIYKENKGI